jgi:SAM-dependent methyltransferase
VDATRRRGLTSSERTQRLVFGEVADLYDRHRPGYPEELFDELMKFAQLGPGDPALEIGAGTGKATVPLVRRGLRLTALEPNHQMAEVARANLAGTAGATMVESSFEEWDPGPVRYGLICSAQAWHWVSPEIGFAKASGLLLPAGILALFWNRPEPSNERIESELDALYRRFAPNLASRLPGEREVDRAKEIEASGHFGPVTFREFRWELNYSVEEYKALLLTQSDHRMLAPDSLGQLLQGVGEVLQDAGGSLPSPYVTRLYMARPRP